jgi:Organic solute transport protein 1
MSLLATPLLIANLGCEMLFILEQRLKAQSIPGDKSQKVLHDVVKTMFDKTFVSEKLFIPQEMYSIQSTRKIFDRLAHSSIMRLSESRWELLDEQQLWVQHPLLLSMT